MQIGLSFYNFYGVNVVYIDMSSFVSFFYPFVVLFLGRIACIKHAT